MFSTFFGANMFLFAQAQARTFCMVLSNLKLKIFVWFRASSSSSLDFSYSFEQAQTFCMLLSKLDLELGAWNYLNLANMGAAQRTPKGEGYLWPYMPRWFWILEEMILCMSFSGRAILVSSYFVVCSLWMFSVNENILLKQSKI